MRSTGVIVGGVVVAPGASELVLPIALAVSKGLTVSDLAHTFAIYPSLSGSITEYSSACAVPIQHKAGDISREADGLSHYWVNHGKVPAVVLSSDVFHSGKPDSSM